MGKVITYGNCFIYLWVVVALSRGMSVVYGGEFWRDDMSSIRLPMLILLSSAVVFTALSCIGMLLKKEWGRKISTLWNVGLGLLVGFVPIISIFIATDFDTVKRTFNSESFINLSMGIVLFILALGLHSQSVKNHFGVSN